MGILRGPGWVRRAAGKEIPGEGAPVHLLLLSVEKHGRKQQERRIPSAGGSGERSGSPRARGAGAEGFQQAHGAEVLPGSSQGLGAFCPLTAQLGHPCGGAGGCRGGGGSGGGGCHGAPAAACLPCSPVAPAFRGAAGCVLCLTDGSAGIHSPAGFLQARLPLFGGPGVPVPQTGFCLTKPRLSPCCWLRTTKDLELLQPMLVRSPAAASPGNDSSQSPRHCIVSLQPICSFSVWEPKKWLNIFCLPVALLVVHMLQVAFQALCKSQTLPCAMV